MTTEWAPSLRVAMVSVHTSPLMQPGKGDAGGLNVYLLELSRCLAGLGIAVEIFTRATSAAEEPVEIVAPGVIVRHIPAGPFEGLDKESLPGELCGFVAGMLQEAAKQRSDYYDVIHGHYWLSGLVGLQVSERWNVPVVQTMHTLARVKNEALPPGESPEPEARELGEERLVAAVDGLIANTEAESADLQRLYQAAVEKIAVIPPAVDLEVFRPLGAPERATLRDEIRASIGLQPDAPLVMFAGRLQALKGPDVLVRAVAEMDESATLVVLGGPSGRPTAARELEALAEVLGVTGRVKFLPPVNRRTLANWFVAADLVAVPSHSESYGLVAAEAGACGTPVVAAAVGGLSTVVRDGETGVLVDGHDPVHWARVMSDLLDQPERRSRLGVAAAELGKTRGWDSTAKATAAVYRAALERSRARDRAK